MIRQEKPDDSNLGHLSVYLQFWVVHSMEKYFMTQNIDHIARLSPSSAGLLALTQLTL